MCFWLSGGITKGLPKESEKYRKRFKNITKTQTRKISANRLDNPSSPTHGVSNCKIRTLFRPTWKTKIKYQIGRFARWLYKGITAKTSKSGAWNRPIWYLIFFFHVGQNNGLILQFDTSWVGEDGLLSTFLDNL